MSFSWDKVFESPGVAERLTALAGAQRGGDPRGLSGEAHLRGACPIYGVYTLL